MGGVYPHRWGPLATWQQLQQQEHVLACNKGDECLCSSEEHGQTLAELDCFLPATVRQTLRRNCAATMHWPCQQRAPLNLGDDYFTIGHFLRGRSLKGRCNIRVYVPVCVCVPLCVCVCVCVCVSLRSPPDPAHTVGLNRRISPPPPTPTHDPSPPFPHPYPQALAWPTLGKNYPLKSARH